MIRSAGGSRLARRSLAVAVLALTWWFGAAGAIGADAATAPLRPAVAVLPPAEPGTNTPIPDSISSYQCTTSSDGSQSCTGTCVSSQIPLLNESAACQNLALRAIDRGRAAEGVRSLRLPSNWRSLTVPEQLFVLADLERVDRGLPPYVGLVPRLDTVALRAAHTATDPSYPTAGLRGEGGNWSVGAPSPLIADLEWMYADGPGSQNVDCPHAHAAGCWGHRNNILGVYTGLHCSTCVMGTGYVANYANHGPVYTQLFIEPGTAKFAPNFTWAANVLPYLH